MDSFYGPSSPENQCFGKIKGGRNSNLHAVTNDGAGLLLAGVLGGGAALAAKLDPPAPVDLTAKGQRLETAYVAEMEGLVRGLTGSAAGASVKAGKEGANA